MSNVAINFKTFRQSYYVFVEKHSLLIWLSEKKTEKRKGGSEVDGQTMTSPECFHSKLWNKWLNNKKGVVSSGSHRQLWVLNQQTLREERVFLLQSRWKTC